MPDLDHSSLSAILTARPPEARQLLPLLQDIQARYRYLPEAALRAVSQRLNLPLARVFAVAGFYRALSLTPKGRTVVKVCCGTACHLRGAPALIGALENELGLSLGQTGPDGAFTLEPVNCLGACALAPVVTVNDQPHGEQTPAGVRQLVKDHE